MSRWEAFSSAPPMMVFGEATTSSSPSQISRAAWNLIARTYHSEWIPTSGSERAYNPQERAPSWAGITATPIWVPSLAEPTARPSAVFSISRIVWGWLSTRYVSKKCGLSELIAHNWMLRRSCAISSDCLVRLNLERRPAIPKVQCQGGGICVVSWLLSLPRDIFTQGGG